MVLVSGKTGFWQAVSGLKMILRGKPTAAQNEREDEFGLHGLFNLPA
jgi:hypothetical protein